MLAKATISILGIAFIIGLLYLLGMAIYTHFFDARQKSIREFKEHRELLKQAIKDAKNEV
jgi:capsular polysaccharide biosynthesis protein